MQSHTRISVRTRYVLLPFAQKPPWSHLRLLSAFDRRHALRILASTAIRQNPSSSTVSRGFCPTSPANSVLSEIAPSQSVLSFRAYERRIFNSCHVSDNGFGHEVHGQGEAWCAPGAFTGHHSVPYWRSRCLRTGHQRYTQHAAEPPYPVVRIGVRNFCAELVCAHFSQLLLRCDTSVSIAGLASAAAEITAATMACFTYRTFVQQPFLSASSTLSCRLYRRLWKSWSYLTTRTSTLAGVCFLTF